MKVGTRKEWLTGRGEGGELRTASATPDLLLQSEIDEQVCLPVHSREAFPSWVVFFACNRQGAVPYITYFIPIAIIGCDKSE
jgi:hypothetical protein